MSVSEVIADTIEEYIIQMNKIKVILFEPLETKKLEELYFLLDVQRNARTSRVLSIRACSGQQSEGSGGLQVRFFVGETESVQKVLVRIESYSYKGFR